MVQVILKGFNILELVASRNGLAVSLTEIAQELNINQATSANIINTLVARGYLEHIGKKKGYKLGPAAYRLTNEVTYEKDIVNASKDLMEELTEKINESCLLGILRNNKRYILHCVNCNQDIQVKLRSERNVYETASGRLLIAFLSDKERERFIQFNGLPDKNIWEQASTTSSLSNELLIIKNNEFVESISENHFVGLAVPVFSKSVVIAGLSVFLPEYRFSENKKSEILNELHKTAKQIENNLNLYLLSTESK